MNHANYRRFRDEVFGLYQAKDYQQALKLIDSQMIIFPEHAFHIYNWRICLAALEGDTQKAIQLFREALDANVWWSENMLRNDEDLASLQSIEEFDKLVNLSIERYQQAQAASKSELGVYPPLSSDRNLPPLLIALHGRSGNISDTAACWQGLNEQGWLVAVPQSSQILGSGAYCWDDRDLAERELSTHFDVLRQKHPFDPAQVVLAGYSQGGGLAILLAVSGKLPVKGFIAVSPSLQGTGVLIDILEAGLPANTRGYLVTGGKDQHAELFQPIQSVLRDYGIPCDLEQQPDLGHDYPEDFSASLSRAIEFIFST
jgi:dienelactone hydrolase